MESHERSTTCLTPSKKVTVNKINSFDKAKIANKFNKIFANIGIELAKNIPAAKTTLETQLWRLLGLNLLSINKLKDTFYSLKISYSPGYSEQVLTVSRNVLVKYIIL